MMDLKQYWGHVRNESDKLATASPEGVVYITSIDDTLRGLVGGRVCEARPHLAARCIIDRTHRKSTPEEVEAFKAERLARERDLADKERKRIERIIAANGRAEFFQPQEPARSGRKQ